MTARSISRPVASPFARSILSRIIGDIWTPADLFAQGQQGVWYEPKPEYLYQDSAGTTPVTADGQPVGLMLDLHKGLKLGPEEVTNGTFSSWTAGTPDNWKVTNGSTSSVSQEENGIRLSSNSDSSRPAIQQSLDMSKFYEMELVITVVSGIISFGAAPGTTGSIASTTSSGTFTVRGRLSSDGFDIRASRSDTEAIVHSASARELPGHHVPQSTAAKKPLYSTTPPLQDYDDVDDEMIVTLPAIASATVATATPSGTVINYPVDLSSGSYTINSDHSGIIIRDGALTASEQQEVTSYLDGLAEV